MNCKETLRREMIEKRKSLNIKSGEKFAEKIKATDEFQKAKTVMIYMPVKGEADVTGLLDENKTFLLPVTEGDNMYPSVMGELEKGYFNVPVPKKKNPFCEKIDVVIVPGVAFDKSFNRMGFGKGYYDRFLNGMDTFKIGVCHSFQMVDNIPCEEHDVKMDMIITEENVWRKGNTL